MDKKEKETSPIDSTELAAFRRQIDEVDDKIIALLQERTRSVIKIGELKRRSTPGQCPIRPGREADMVRRIVKKCEGTDVLPAAAAAIWRTLIGMSTNVEGALHLSVFTPDRDDNLYWLGREYFGPFVPITRQPHIKRVIGDVMDGKASVGIVPFLRSDDSTYWWTNLIQQGADTPKVFAHVPFIYQDTPGKDAPSALAIARIAPEETGDDISLIVFEADHNVSQNRLQTVFTQAKLEVSWINVATLNPSTRHHLVSVKGFITTQHAGMKAVIDGLGASIVNATFLGAYAVPVVLKSSAAKTQNLGFHAAASSN